MGFQVFFSTHFTERVVYGNNANVTERLPYGDANNNNYKYYLKTAGVNVQTGTVQTFTCKQGFRPYLNYQSALEAIKSGVENRVAFGPQPGEKFSCTCEDGKWVCQHVCRCESYCEDKIVDLFKPDNVDLFN